MIRAKKYVGALDYIRLTLHRDGLNSWRGTRNLTLAGLIAGEERARGARADKWKLLGYRGERVGRLFVGEGAQGQLIQISGSAAAEAAGHVWRMEYDNIPRLDLALTVWAEKDSPWLAEEYARQYRELRGYVRQQGRAPRARLIQGWEYGSSLYIGRRGGTYRMLRIYDKWRESERQDEWEYAWRYELELTNAYAVAAYDQIRSASDKGAQIISIVLGLLERLGLEAPELGVGYRISPLSIPREESDDERRLKWLHECVRPAIDRMIARGIMESQVLDALGLAPEPEPTQLELRSDQETAPTGNETKGESV